ncbi:MAG: MBL fold metallo-hydrolase, partial [Acidimicrobiales bacterium]
VTPVHRDHCGLAGRIRELTGAWIGVHSQDAALLTTRYRSNESFHDSIQKILSISGSPKNSLPELGSSSMDVSSFATMTPPDRLIEDGDLIGLPGWDLAAIWTPGHSPGHICLYSRSSSLMFTGDHVLPHISPNISFHASNIANPLGDYLDSLEKVEKLYCEDVLPGHEWRFSGLGERVRELLSHHGTRLDEIRQVLSENQPMTCWELATRLTWSRPLDEATPFIVRSASGETLAHLAYLQNVGEITRTDQLPAEFHVSPGLIRNSNSHPPVN